MILKYNKVDYYKMVRLKYDYAMLKNICDEGGITLLEDYSNKYITRDTRIIAKCVLCENSFNKSLNDLHKKRNFGCVTCAKLIKFERIKNTMVEKYGVEYAAQSDIFMKKMRETTFEKFGVDHAVRHKDIKERIKQTNLEKYGCDYGLQNERVKEKGKQSNINKYGVENQLQRKEIKEQIKHTKLEKYGAEYSSQCTEIKEKTKQTCLEKYGVEHFTQTNIMKNKTKETCLKKYGVEYILQCPEIKEKAKQTCLEKYGVEYIGQCPEFQEKITKRSYYLKEYLLPSGKIINIQGYENYALDKLLNENIKEEEIITGAKNVPEIWYYDSDKNKSRRHFVDIYIPSKNKCIEIKSIWTFNVNKDIVFLKQKAGKELGYLYEIWVYDKGGTCLQIID